MAKPISASHDECIKAFEELLNICQSPDITADIENEFGRYKVWASNVGTPYYGHTYRISQGYRLKDASFYRDRILEMLRDLISTLQRVTSVVEGESLPFEEQNVASESQLDPDDSSDLASNSIASSGSSSSSDSQIGASNVSFVRALVASIDKKPTITTPETLRPGKAQERKSRPNTEISLSREAIKDILNSLYKIATVIRRPLPSDRNTKSMGIDIHHFAEFDQRYVCESFLLQILSSCLDWSPWTQYKATTFVAPARAPMVVEEVVSVADTSSSYQSTNSGREILRIPPRPKSLLGEELEIFERLYCHVLCEITSFQSWNFRRPLAQGPSSCPLCLKIPRKLESHLARHHAQLALFAIPRVFFSDDGSNSGLTTSEHAAGRSSGSKVSSHSSYQNESYHSDDDHDLENKGMEEISESLAETSQDPIPDDPSFDCQRKLVTVTNVAEDIQGQIPLMEMEKALEYASTVCTVASRLYATLACINKGPDIRGLLAEGITSDDLPFVLGPGKQNKLALTRRNGGMIKTFDFWEDEYLEEFECIHWWMSSPIFKLHQELYEFDDRTILPFVRLHEGPRQGGYSEVYPVRIHPSHHEFWESTGSVDDELLVAIKGLFSDTEIEFQRQRTILTAMNMKTHPYLVKLLATYKYNGKYHLMFPFAPENHRMYWERRPSPAFDKETMVWSLRQMTGLAEGLWRIHIYEVTRALNSDNMLKNVPRGRFGLGHFHGAESRSNVDPDSVFSSPTYEPPECKLRLPVSRAYNIWSLGCLYFEFITWLLKGSLEIDTFSDYRGRVATRSGINDDNVFTIIVDADGTRVATVREQVVAWVDQLHTYDKCSPLVHDLLDLTINGLLVVDTAARYPSSWVFHKLDQHLKKAQADEVYLLTPAPRKLRTTPTHGERPIPEAPIAPQVTFSDSPVQRQGLPPSINRPIFPLPNIAPPRDLVRCALPVSDPTLSSSIKRSNSA
ncbi:uncharacterized protein PAC_07474 [Phialocephala subalpina]|uniref:Protein kinase domain-containing protein n=1 Tax=Phialocephala subalpina TaxID=576137 RepID=A0A1L7WXV6_9HELO|nr:uncharacterized protein PAC_07474 [Phialocephala subalpina]